MEQFFYNPKCEICGRFVKWSDHYSWTYYGGCTDLEPPYPTYACPSCYEAQTEHEKQSTVNVCWIKPSRTRYAEYLE